MVAGRIILVLLFRFVGVKAPVTTVAVKATVPTVWYLGVSGYDLCAGVEQASVTVSATYAS